MVRKYDSVDFQSDIDWFVALGVPEHEAEDYISYMMGIKPTRVVKEKLDKIKMLRELEK